MAGEKVPLGTAYARPYAYADQQKGKMTDEQRLSVLEQQVSMMLKIIFALRVKLKKDVRQSVKAAAAKPIIDAPHGLNKDGLPNELICIGDSEKQQFPLCMTVKQEHYEIGERVFPSLSAAAEAVSGVRRSGWAFWKLPDGRTLKEAFKS